MDRQYDYLVIGSGPAGHTSAIRAAQLGLKTAVIEKDEDMFGGACLNEGCIPAKSLYRGAKIYDMVRRSPELCGLEVKHGCADMAAMVKKSREHAAGLRKGLEFLFKKNGVDLIMGEAFFEDKNALRVRSSSGENILKAHKILVAAGSFPVGLAGMPFDGNVVINSSDGIRLGEIPKKILIVGGGAIGTEFASFFNIMGSEVTIVEIEDTLLPSEDKEIGRRLEAVLLKKGVDVLCGARVRSLLVEGDEADAVFSSTSGEKTGTFDKVLISVGRAPATAGLNLPAAGIKADEKGFIPVDGHMRVAGGHIFAAGDVVKTPMLAHVASAEGEVAAETAAGKSVEPIDYTCVPNASYGDVQTASVGMTEEAVKARGMAYKTGKQFFKANGRAVVNCQTEGFIKVLADASTKKLLGVHVIGYEAAEIIHEFAVAKRAGLTVGDIIRTVHAHPTFSETAVDACRAVFGQAVHG